MNTDIDLYFVDYEEGSMGSFISMLINLFLSQQTDPFIIDPMGSVHHSYSAYQNNNFTETDVNNMHLRSVIAKTSVKYLTIRSCYYNNMIDFKSVRGFFITFKPEDRLRILCNVLYKKYSFGITNVRSFGHPLRDQYLKNIDYLDTAELKERLEEYIEKSNMGFCRFPQRFMLKVPIEDVRTPYRYLKWNDFLECVSDEYRDRVHSIEFSDITENPEKVLEILSTATGMPITSAIRQTYQKYLESQVLPEKLVKVLSA
jgi:hypothetical protein